MCTCDQVYVYVWHTGAYVWMWEPEGNLGYCPLGAMLSVLRQSLSVIWRSLITLGWLTIKHSILAHLEPPSIGLYAAATYTF